MGSVVRIPTELREAKTPFDAIRRVREDGSEFWSARDLMPLMGYRHGNAWNNFAVPLKRAMQAARNQNHDLTSLFSESRELVPRGNDGAKQERQDFHLSRFAAYLVAMNGDPNKPEVAAAQAYFAIQTRVAETRTETGFRVPQTMSEALRLAADLADEKEEWKALATLGEEQVTARAFAAERGLSLESSFIIPLSQTASRYQKRNGMESHRVEATVYRDGKGKGSVRDCQTYEIEALEYALGRIQDRSEIKWRRSL